MENKIRHDVEYQCYPGRYVSVFKDKEIEKEFRRSRRFGENFPEVNITELADEFKVEVAIPGVKREDFMVFASANMITVMIMQKRRSGQSENCETGQFNYDHFCRRVLLPKNADTEFISAEYRSGILRILVPKMKVPGNCKYTRIAVY